MLIQNPFDILFVEPFLNILIALYQGILALHIPYAFGFAIIVLTVLIRAILYPLTASQLRASQKMQRVAPHINKLKEKHKNDAKMLQQETMRLYKEHGINPAAGCLPLLLQAPVFIALFQVFNKLVSIKSSVLITEINRILYFPALKLHSPIDFNFFGLPLAKTPEHLFPVFGVVVFLIPALTVFLQLIQSKMMFPSRTKSVERKNTSIVVAKDVKKDSPGKEDDFAKAMQTQMTYLFPFLIGFSAYKFPLGMSLYWNVITIFGILQQYRVQGLGGLTEWTDRLQRK